MKNRESIRKDREKQYSKQGHREGRGVGGRKK
jgi:hypothetical protein